MMGEHAERGRKKTVNTCIHTCMLAFTTIAHRISHGLPKLCAADPGKSA